MTKDEQVGDVVVNDDEQKIPEYETTYSGSDIINSQFEWDVEYDVW